jgi:hypothetical protein
MPRKKQSIGFPTGGSFFQSSKKPTKEPSRITQEVKRIMAREAESEKPIAVFRAHVCPTSNQILAFSDERSRRHLPAAYVDQVWDMRHPERDELRGLPAGHYASSALPYVARPPDVFEESEANDGPSQIRERNLLRRITQRTRDPQERASSVADCLGGSRAPIQQLKQDEELEPHAIKMETTYRRLHSSMVGRASPRKLRRTASQYADQIGPMLQGAAEPRAVLGSTPLLLSANGLSPSPKRLKNPAPLPTPLSLVQDSYGAGSTQLPLALKPTAEHRMRKREDDTAARAAQQLRDAEFRVKWAGRRRWVVTDEYANLV